jgi:hypothetical protein
MSIDMISEIIEELEMIAAAMENVDSKLRSALANLAL